MKNIARTALFVAVVLLGQYAVAQPPARQKQEPKKQQAKLQHIPYQLGESAQA